MKKMSIKETRANFAEVIEAVNASGEAVTITKFGKPKAVIQPYNNDNISSKYRTIKLEDSAGMWKNYELKERTQSRHAKIFD